MRAYVYCSYKFSPDGFQIGTIKYDAAQKNFYVPTKNNLDNFVICAFEEGIVRKVYGLIPDSNKYIFLVKKLQQNNIDDPNEGMIDFHMNFAFEFDNFNDYNNFCGNFNRLLEERTAATECAKFIVPDRNVETFALKINAELFNGFIKDMLSKSDGGQVDKKIFVEVISSKLDESKLKEIFGRDFEKVGEKIFAYPAVHSASNKKKIFVILLTGALIIGIILGIYWIFFNTD